MKLNDEKEEKPNAKFKDFSLYIHFPYCTRKCPYCDFNTYAERSIPEDTFINSILRELSFRMTLEEWQGRHIKTVFFGGGTPSLISAAGIAQILEKLPPRKPNCEITIETNPGSTSREKLSQFLKAGVNRLSFGAQTFNAEILKTLGRDHTVNDTFEIITAAKAVGFKNISLDLIYGVPGQSLEMLQSDLQTAVSLSPQHVSTYNLTIEKGTPFYEQKANGRLILPPDEAVLNMMDLIDQYLFEHNYKQYEISNYAFHGFESQHNFSYWNGDDYLGIGPGAHSFVANKRWANLALPAQYEKSLLEKGSAESWQEVLSLKEQIGEFFFVGLRKIAGVSCKEFEDKFHQTPFFYYEKALSELSQHDFLSFSEDRILLTRKGLRMYDSVIEKFL